MKKNYRTALQNVSGKKLPKAQTQNALSDIDQSKYSNVQTTNVAGDEAWKADMRQMHTAPFQKTTPYGETIITDPLNPGWNTRVDQWHESGNPWLNRASYKDTRETISKDRTKLGTLGQKFLNIFRPKSRDKDVHTKQVTNPNLNRWIANYKKGGSLIR